jgi:hypothetical protein
VINVIDKYLLCDDIRGDDIVIIDDDVGIDDILLMMTLIHVIDD